MMNYIARDLSIKKFDENRWLVNTQEGKNILLNERATILLTILVNSTNREEAIKAVNERLDLQLTKPEFETLIQSTFNGFGVLKGDVVTHVQFSYLSLKVPLLNARLAGLLAAPFKSIFRPSIFWLMLISAFFLNSTIAIYSFYEGLLTILNANIALFTILVSSSMLVHELGHIAACRQFGIRHGAIGFGFYFIFPVVYADITQVWTATKSQRIIANAGGIYLELIYGGILFLTFVLTKDITFLLVTVAIFLKAITELNPFIRYDGYWLLSDVTKTPNLMKKSNDALKDFFFTKNFQRHFSNLLHLRWEVSQRDSLLLFYGLANTLILGIYITYVLVNFHIGIIHFPELLFSLLQKAINFKLLISDFPSSFLWILGLYILACKTAIQHIVKQVKKMPYYLSNQRLD